MEEESVKGCEGGEDGGREGGWGGGRGGRAGRKGKSCNLPPGPVTTKQGGSRKINFRKST